MSKKCRPARAPSTGSRAPSTGFKGRHWFVIWLLAFLACALLIVRRQQTAFATSRELQQLQQTRGALEVSKSALIGEIHKARSRAVLVPLAQQKLGLRLPQDSEITILQDPRPR